MEKWRFRMVPFLLCSCLLHSLELCVSLNDEGRALLAFKAGVEADPYCALSNWNEEDANPCSWRGVKCSEDGDVVSLNLRSFSLRGTLSPELGKLIALKTFILRGNTFYGPIPGEIAKLQKLEEVDLGHNNLSGTIPDTLEGTLSLETLNFKTSTMRQLLGTQGTQPPYIEYPNQIPSSPSKAPYHSLRPPTPPRPPPPPPPLSPSSPPPSLSPSPASHSSELPQPPVIQSSTSSNKKKHWITYVAIGAPIFVVVVALALFLIFYRACKVVNVMPWRTGLSGKLQTGAPSLRRSELEAACEGFSNIIGSLKTCSLYKGTLSNGVEIAVMSTPIMSPKDWSAQHEDEFRKKISVLSTVNHKNFMNLIGYCEEEEPLTRMMVFEYAPNGTLFEHLHIREAEQLDWAARLRIATGIIYCLEHIEQLNPPVTLRNLDSSSIYLTEDYAAKVSDLELCLEGEATKTGSQGSDHENNVSKFGIILLEIISGRPPSSEGDTLLLWASDYLKGQRPLKDMVDPSLVVLDEDISALMEVIKLCISADREDIPTAAKVADRMRLITSITPEDATPKLSPLWWAELEIVSS